MRSQNLNGSCPLVSIIIPVYNRAHLILETLESLKNQTYENWECIIVDDGSTDATEQVVLEYTRNDPRFSLYCRPIEHLPGANGARNYGFKHTKGQYVCWFDSDDLMSEDFLKQHLDNFNANPEIDLSVCNNQIFENHPAHIVGSYEFSQKYNQVIYDLVYGGLFFLTPTSVWKKEFLNQKDLFDEHLLQAQESDFNFRRATEGLKFNIINTVLVYVRRGHSSIDSSYNRNILFSFYQYFDKVSLYFKDKKSPLDIEIQNYLHRRKMIRYSEIRNVDATIKRDVSKIAYSLICATFKNKTKLSYKFRVSLGIILILILNKGYVLIK